MASSISEKKNAVPELSVTAKYWHKKRPTDRIPHGHRCQRQHAYREASGAKTKKKKKTENAERKEDPGTSRKEEPANAEKKILVETNQKQTTTKNTNTNRTCKKEDPGAIFLKIGHTRTHARTHERTRTHTRTHTHTHTL